MNRILIITVSYKGAESTEGFLRSASYLEGFSESHVIVVENASNDGSAERLRSFINQFPNVELLESAQNRGYFGAASWALKQYAARSSQPDWTIVCNNDIQFNNCQFLAKLLQIDTENAGVIAPSIIELPVGVDCNPFMRGRPSLFKLLRCKFWNSSYYLMWFKQWLSPYVRSLRHRLFRERVPTQTPGPVYAPHGAFLIFSKLFFESGGYIDDGFFLYAEEFAVAEICRRLNLPVIHDPRLRVWHNAHAVTGRMCNRNTFQYGREGLNYALRTYFFPAQERKISDLEI